MRNKRLAIFVAMLFLWLSTFQVASAKPVNREDVHKVGTEVAQGVRAAAADLQRLATALEDEKFAEELASAVRSNDKAAVAQVIKKQMTSADVSVDNLDQDWCAGVNVSWTTKKGKRMKVALSIGDDC